MGQFETTGGRRFLSTSPFTRVPYWVPILTHSQQEILVRKTNRPLRVRLRSLVLMRKGDEGWSLVDLRGSAPMAARGHGK